MSQAGEHPQVMNKPPSSNSDQLTSQGSDPQEQYSCFVDFRTVDAWEISPLMFAQVNQENTISPITYIFHYISMAGCAVKTDPPRPKNADVQNM